ncbi:MAG: bifunctional DNA-binding transcriptional regulator/O6-methylguanine-DNA methyltransferase Ada [Pyrinomonadaceae bacterium]
MMNQETLNQAKINEWRWQVVQSKDANFDNVFYTGVRTTGIYCQPSCRAKTPKRENVTFFASREEAEISGFRACLRCKPNLESYKNTTAELVAKACQLIELNHDENVSLETLSAELNVSAGHLQRVFKNALGVSPKEFSDKLRLDNFKKQVKETDVTTALYESGFGSSRALYEKASANLGMTPAVYRKGGKNMRINFTIADSQLGKLLVAATTKGICAVTLGNSEEVLAANLRQEFSAAEIAPDDALLRSHVAAILLHLAGERKILNLPLDLQATAFQSRVWAELRKIPYGETRSYKQIAEQIGQPTAVRAVARACATNPVALVTPCHRVIGADGSLSGYRWGIKRKSELLKQEKLSK